MLAQINQAYPEDVRIVYRHFPLISIHDKAALAAQASEAAGRQDRFWEMHDRLFENQRDWSQMPVDEFEDWLADQAIEMGLEIGLFSTDLNSQPIKDLVQKAWDHNVAVGLPGTPFLLVNGQIYPNNLPMDFENLSGIIKLNLLEKNQFTSCPPLSVDPSRQYIATLHTEKGDIVFELFAGNAPLAVNNFIFLARNGWYDGVTFHRVISGFIAQAGDPSGTGFGGPGYAFANEISPNLKFDKAGVIGMANAGPDTNGSQFFITLGPTPNLDGSYTIFGQVVEGIEIVQKLALRDPSTATTPGDKILSMDIEEK